jgi:hypothetical protein
MRPRYSLMVFYLKPVLLQQVGHLAMNLTFLQGRRYVPEQVPEQNNMNIETIIYLNQLAQTIKPWDKGKEWFLSLPTDVQLEVLNTLSYLILQAGANGKDAELAVNFSSLKPAYTCCQLLLKVAKDGPIGSSVLQLMLSKIVNLPEYERGKSFICLIALFSVADKKRRKKGIFPDRYWWHRDLADEKVVQEIIRTGGRP